MAFAASNVTDVAHINNDIMMDDESKDCEPGGRVSNGSAALDLAPSGANTTCQLQKISLENVNNVPMSADVDAEKPSTNRQAKLGLSKTDSVFEKPLAPAPKRRGRPKFTTKLDIELKRLRNTFTNELPAVIDSNAEEDGTIRRSKRGHIPIKKFQSPGRNLSSKLVKSKKLQKKKVKEQEHPEAHSLIVPRTPLCSSTPLTAEIFDLPANYTSTIGKRRPHQQDSGYGAVAESNVNNVPMSADVDAEKPSTSRQAKLGLSENDSVFEKPLAPAPKRRGRPKFTTKLDMELNRLRNTFTNELPVVIDSNAEEDGTIRRSKRRTPLCSSTPLKAGISNLPPNRVSTTGKRKRHQQDTGYDVEPESNELGQTSSQTDNFISGIELDILQEEIAPQTTKKQKMENEPQQKQQHYHEKIPGTK